MDALAQGRALPGAPPCPLRDVRTRSAVRTVRLLGGGVGVEVETDAEASGRSNYCTPWGLWLRWGVKEKWS